jgi:hypothetical protein
VDITEEILWQHHEQRRMFALLDEIDPGDTAKLAAVWRRLVVLLEVHAAAEERYFYPRLLELGRGAPGGDDPAEETKDAIKDHNEIRDAVAAADRHEVGSDDWWRAVRDAREANSDHMAEEERDDLADFRRHVDLVTRHRIALDFLAYEAAHAGGVRAGNRAGNKDPDGYVAEHR